MHDLLEDELRRRLQNYKEEPAEDLWNKITTEIPTIEPIPGWTTWIPGVSTLTVLIMLVSVEFIQVNEIDIQSERFISEIKKIEKQPLQNDSLSSIKFSTTELHKISQGPGEMSNSSLSEITQENNAIEHDFNTTTYTNNFDRDASLTPVHIQADQHNENSTMDSLRNNNIIISDSVVSNAMLTASIPDTITSIELDDIHKDEADEKKASGKKDFYFLVMPTFGYNRVEANKSDNVIIESIHRIPGFSFKRLGLRMEAGVELPLSNRLKLTGGLLYFQRKQTIDYSERVVDSMKVVPAMAGEISLEPVYSYLDKSIEYELKNVGVHVGLNFLVANGKFLHSIGTGLEFQRSLKSTKNSEGLNDEQPSAYVFYNLYYRFQYPVNGKLNAVVQPMLNYSISLDENFQAPFYVKPYGMGLSLGLIYKF